MTNSTTPTAKMSKIGKLASMVGAALLTASCATERVGMPVRVPTQTTIGDNSYGNGGLPNVSATSHAFVSTPALGACVVTEVTRPAREVAGMAQLPAETPVIVRQSVDCGMTSPGVLAYFKAAGTNINTFLTENGRPPIAAPAAQAFNQATLHRLSGVPFGNMTCNATIVVVGSPRPGTNIPALPPGTVLQEFNGFRANGWVPTVPVKVDGVLASSVLSCSTTKVPVVTGIAPGVIETLRSPKTNSPYSSY